MRGIERRATTTACPHLLPSPAVLTDCDSLDRYKRPVERQDSRSSKAPIGATPKYETLKNAIKNTRTDVSETGQAVRPAGKRLTNDNPAEVVVSDCQLITAGSR